MKKVKTIRDYEDLDITPKIPNDGIYENNH